MRFNPLTALTGFAAELRFPTLFKLTVGLLLVSWLWPFDPLPFVDEILTALATLLLASWKKERQERDKPPIELPPR